MLDRRHPFRTHTVRSMNMENTVVLVLKTNDCALDIRHHTFVHLSEYQLLSEPCPVVRLIYSTPTK